MKGRMVYDGVSYFLRIGEISYQYLEGGKVHGGYLVCLLQEI